MKRTNIEIKAKSGNQDAVRKILKSQGADFRGTDHQVDTYFKVSSGRLKLREGKIENHLIHYQRANMAGPKESDVMLFATEPGSSLKEILARSLGILAVVDKEREIYFIGNVKFHIDSVKELGTFVEIEAIGSGGKISREKLLGQCRHYLELLGIGEKDLVPDSYSDMLLKKGEN